jgi:uncharacterized protein (DUF2147 family)
MRRFALPWTSKNNTGLTMLHCPRRALRATLICSAFLLASGLSAADAADPTGDWRVADGVANIRVAQCNGSMWGAVAWEKNPGGRDTNNPDVSKQNRPTLGMPILIDMKKKPGLDQWEGQVYNAKDGQSYSATITPVSNDQLEIKGCVLGFLCGGETWTRVGPPIQPNPADSMARGPSRTIGAAPKTPAPKPPSAASAARSGQKMPAPAQAAESVGDICLLPDIAGFAH